MSTLYIRLPPRAIADSAPLLQACACPFALVSDGGKIEREGVEVLSGLSETIAKIQCVALLVDGSNVTLLRVKVPPLSAARLKAALPNLVEEQLLCDPAECVIVAGGLSDGLRTLAVMQRAWLELLEQTIGAIGARQIAVFPAQLCLPYQSGRVTAAINVRNSDIELTLRLSEQDGIGLVIGSALVEEGAEQNSSVTREAIRSLCAVVPTVPVTLYVPPALLSTYQEAASLNKRISVLADNWSYWIAAARVTTLDMMAGLGKGAAARLNWRPWRWPLVMAVALVLFNAAALNIEWWRMQGEGDSLRMLMVQIYKSAYPKESVILDPLMQMQQKNASAKRHSGLAAADDFTTITAAFGEAWAGITPGKLPVAALDYRDRSLFVRIKSVLSHAEGQSSEVSAQQMKAALAKRGLSLVTGGGKQSPEQAGEVVWQIRGAK
ncbi:MAG: type II secretion system protein GspL [Gallionella sp.]